MWANSPYIYVFSTFLQSGGQWENTNCSAKTALGVNIKCHLYTVVVYWTTNVEGRARNVRPFWCTAMYGLYGKIPYMYGPYTYRTLCPLCYQRKKIGTKRQPFLLMVSGQQMYGKCPVKYRTCTGRTCKAYKMLNVRFCRTCTACTVAL